MSTHVLAFCSRAMGYSSYSPWWVAISPPSSWHVNGRESELLTRDMRYSFVWLVHEQHIYSWKITVLHIFQMLYFIYNVVYAHNTVLDLD